MIASRLKFDMASCLGPNLKKHLFPPLLGGVGKFFLGLIVTGYFLTLFAAERLEEFGDPKAAASLVVLLIISPIWFGFYSLFGIFIKPIHWSLNLIASSIASAAVAVWVLPGFLFAIFIIIFGFLSNIFS